MLNVISGTLSAGAPPVSPTSYESIATTTLSSNQTTITFSSIPATYKHLQIRLLARSTHLTFAGVDGVLRFNGDSATNYSWHYLLGDGATTSASAGATQSSINTGIIASGGGSAANIYATTIIDILDYADTNKYKTTRTLAGLDKNGTGGDMRFSSGSWRSTSAISSITLTTDPSRDFIQYSSFALYGIKG
jgi:hypothetical protein